jgi:uncharacterized membrane protein YhaH (DUF805 family)
MSSFYRWGSLSGIVFAVLFVLAFLVGGSSPDASDSNAKISQYLAKSSSYHRNVAALFIAIVAVVALVAFFAAVRTQLTTAAAELGSHGSLVLAAGTASAVSLLAAAVAFVTGPITAHDYRATPFDPNIYRLTQDLGFAFWVASGLFAALALLAVAVAAFRVAALPRWFAWTSLVLGILSIGVVVFVGIFAFFLWTLVAGIYLTARPLQPGATTA